MAQSIYQTRHWRRLRRVVLKRCRGKCERCSRELAGAGHLHHKTYERAGQEAETDVEMICLLCHGNEHPRRTFLAPVLHRRRQEEPPFWKKLLHPKKTRKRPPKVRRQKKAKKARAVEPYWDEINGAAYASLMERQRSAREMKQAREERQRKRKQRT